MIQQTSQEQPRTFAIVNTTNAHTSYLVRALAAFEWLFVFSVVVLRRSENLRPKFLFQGAKIIILSHTPKCFMNFL